MHYCDLGDQLEASGVVGGQQEAGFMGSGSRVHRNIKQFQKNKSQSASCFPRPLVPDPGSGVPLSVFPALPQTLQLTKGY